MNMILAFLKRNLFELICGGVALAGLVMCLLAYSHYDSIKQEMEEATQLAREVDKYQRNPVNRRVIQATEQYNNEIKKQGEDVITLAAAKNARKPLLDNVFPRFASANVPYEFVEAYQSAFGPMLQELRARGVPTQYDYEYYGKVIDRELGEREIDPNELKQSPEKFTADELLRWTRETRASIEIAHRCYCYATLDSFQQQDFPQGVAPDLSAMWEAQLGLWLQKDVVDAIDRLNRAAAKRYEEQTGQSAWVGYLPVKHLLSIGIGRYQAQPGQGPGAMGPAGMEAPSFTGRRSGPLYDVVQLTVQVIVDSRDLLSFVEEVYKTNFYVLIDADLQSVPADTSHTGPIYGPAPVVQATLTFEGYLLRENYDPLAPQPVRKDMGSRDGG
jgi:hypothetical protein